MNLRQNRDSPRELTRKVAGAAPILSTTMKPIKVRLTALTCLQIKTQYFAVKTYHASESQVNMVDDKDLPSITI